MVRSKTVALLGQYCHEQSNGGQPDLMIRFFVKWEIYNRPTPPNGKSRPWIFHGRPAETTDSLSYSYDLRSEEGKLKFLRVTMHHKHRKVEDEVQALPSQWWDAEKEISPTLRYSPEVAPTLADTPMEVSEDTTSPWKRRLKTEEQKFSAGRYRCLAYGIACCNTKEWAGDKEAAGKFTAKIQELAQILRTQVVHHLLNVDGSWKAAWSPDPAATTRTEAGTLPTDLSCFESVLKREQRWICGLTLQTAESQRSGLGMEGGQMVSHRPDSVWAVGRRLS